MRIYGVMILLAGGLGACAGLSTQRPLQVQADALYDRNIVVVRQASPELDADGIDENLVETYKLADPAARIGRGLAISLATERGMIVLSTSGLAADDHDSHALAAAHPGADYVLDVKTLDWALDNYATARNRYRLKYSAQLRLVDAQGEVAAASRCQTEQGDVDNPASREDLLMQDAALVKGYLDLATARCIEHAARNMLGLRDPETQVASTRGQPIRVPPARETLSLAARAPVNAPMPSVHDFFDAGVEPAPTATPTQRPTPLVTVAPRATVAPLPTPRPTPQLAVAPLPQATPAPTPAPTAAPRPSATPAPRRPEPERIAAAPAPVAPAEDDLLRTDRLTPAARASGEVIELLEDTPFRDSPRLTTKISRTLPMGTEIVVRQRVYNAEGEWWFIIIPGDIGWMRSPDPIPYGSPRAGTDTR